MSIKPENYLIEKAKQEKIDFIKNRPMKIKLQTWKRFQLKVLVVSTFIPFLICNVLNYLPISIKDGDEGGI